MDKSSQSQPPPFLNAARMASLFRELDGALPKPIENTGSAEPICFSNHRWGIEIASSSRSDVKARFQIGTIASSAVASIQKSSVVASIQKSSAEIDQVMKTRI